MLFGVTTPLAKEILATTHPLLVAGLLYLGSGLGLAFWVVIADRGRISTGLSRSDWPWLASVIATGGIAAPALLMYGLTKADAASTSLLLNLEVVLTALIAWIIFREATSSRIVVGFGAILAGSLLLAWPHDAAVPMAAGPSLAIAGACLFWALDNNLTRRISTGDARIIAGIKGLAAGLTNTVLALTLGAHWPAPTNLVCTLALGFAGYGISLVLFVYSLRNLGTARTGAYFATAPFVGSVVAIMLYGEPGGWEFWVATACMAGGVWLHLSETHAHPHVHEPLVHSHAHVHDEHHQHSHPTDWDGSEPHAHEHQHEPLSHSHPHFPDVHHQHSH